MKISKVDNQPNFQARFSKDAVTRKVFSQIRNDAIQAGKLSSFNLSCDCILNTRKHQKLKLMISEDGKKLMAKPKNFLKDLFGKNEHFEQEIQNNKLHSSFQQLVVDIVRKS